MKNYIEIHNYVSESTFQIKVKTAELSDVTPISADTLRIKIPNQYLIDICSDYTIWVIYHKL